MKNLSSHRLLLVVLLLLGAQLSWVSCWKRDEFRNCNQTPFCKRARSRKPGSSSLIATDVTIDDGDLTAKLVPKNNPLEEEQIKPLILTLSVYQDGTVRFNIFPVFFVLIFSCIFLGSKPKLTGKKKTRFLI